MHIAPERLLAPEDLRALSARSDMRGTLQLGIHIALLLGAGWWVAQSAGWMEAPAMLALGLVQVALFAPLHETMHQTAFASRRANAIVGWLSCCPSLHNWHFYTAFHLAHHRHTQIPGRDPELAAKHAPSLGEYVYQVSGVAFWRMRLRVIRDAWRGDFSAYRYITPRLAAKIIFSVRAMCVLVVGVACLSGWLFGWATPLTFWIIPQLVAQPFLRAYLLAEHTGCTEDANGLTNTRTTLTNSLVRLLMWNMPYHAEHHLYPSIPFHRLGDAHAALQARLGVVQAGYVRWHAGYLQTLKARR
jgi:fatty acid desaturase